jgi:hypothetical protein
MIDELPQWRIAIAEGQARGHPTPDEQPPPDP